MTLPSTGTRLVAILVAVLTGTSAAGTSTATGGVSSNLSIVARAKEPSAASPPSLAALRLDNYVDVVDSVLNARVRARRTISPAIGPAETDEAALGAAFGAAPGRGPSASDDAREDTLHVSRVARPPRLPAGALVVTTTAAFTGSGAPAGAATWPPATGRLSISAADGSRIELDADTGDIASVDVTIVSGTRLHTFREPWTTWAPWVLNDR